MKQLLIAILSSLLVICFSCHTSDENEPVKKLQQKIENPKRASTSTLKMSVIDPKTIVKDYKTWYSYTYYNIRLAQDFIALDTDSVIIQKAEFLDKLATGDFIPYKVSVPDQQAVYRLFRLQHPAEDIQSGIKQMAAIEMEHFKMEGRQLPDYSFTDLNGKKYSKVTTKGNSLLLKCWFIHCVACVKEFPELNQLVSQYRDKNDLLFVSLAIDKKEELVSFLEKKPFKYAVVPKAEEYMTQKLGITAYPTHILVDKEGKIVKVTNSVEDMIPFLEKQVGKTLL